MPTGVELQRVILALRRRPEETERAYTARLEELIGLTEAAGGRVEEIFVQERARADSATYLGSGKVEEIQLAVERLEATLVVFGEELSPAQVRNLEARLNSLVIDRTQLILDIFALRAKTKEGRLQVEIAQLQYLMPRLTGHGREMSRLGGGIGTRGPGETKLESDRRRLRQRMTHLREQLAKVRRHREVQRERRGTTTLVVALVGYTNAGKTTLLQRWTRDRGTVAVEDGRNRLFDTLDPIARRVRAGTLGELVLLDTVGFVSNLPHFLVDAFRATLEEAAAADLLVHVVDASYQPEQALKTTYQVLAEIGALDKPVLTFFNKTDQATDLPGPDTQAVQSIYGSALTGENILELYRAVEQRLGMDPVQLSIEGDIHSQALWKDVAQVGRVIESQVVSDDRIKLSVQVERRFVSRVRDRLAQSTAVQVEVESDWEEPEVLTSEHKITAEQSERKSYDPAGTELH
ncbi:MAG: GTPase HflX [Alicyclobacillus sp. RIFOXYA1_FULL_53_8]|nr:MAG: GTPase HflX [Alicyclobacillus sp. RIFOXYA1_FULL_53_8]